MKLCVLCTLISVTCLAFVQPICGKNWDIDKILEERGSRECPEYCTCTKSVDNTIVKCQRITANQQFDNLVTSFVLSTPLQPNTLDEPLVLDEKFFYHLHLKSVDAISIINITLNSIDSKAFEGLDDLSTIYLINNNIAILDPNTFANNPSLRRLSLSKNPLSFTQKVHYPYVLNAIKLEQLDLSSCNLYNLLPTTLSQLAELTFLNLETNSLINIDPTTFANLTSLEEINLGNNKIESLNPRLFDQNTYLDKLSLYKNPLSTMQGIILPRLVTLDLSYCNFTQLYENSFDGFEKLVTLNISYNTITQIHGNVFSKMSLLRNLDLSNNKLIGPLDSRLFLQNDEITNILLGSNFKMASLPEGGFQGYLKDVSKLDLSGCGLVTLSGVLKNFSNLARLDLSQNQIEIIKARDLPRKLQVLSLAGNKISNVNSITFPKECQLRQLSLNNNPIKSLSVQNFDNLPYLAKLDLGSCAIERIWSDQIEDNTPAVKSLRYLYLAKNNLERIVPSDLEVFNGLRMLDVSLNPLACNDNLFALRHHVINHEIQPYDNEHTDIGSMMEKSNWDDIWHKACGPNYQFPREEDPESIQSNVNRPDQLVYVIEDVDTEAEDNYDDYENYPENDEPITTEINEVVNSGLPTLVNMSKSSFQLVVLILVACGTFTIIVLLVLALKLCKQRLVQQREALKRRRADGSIGYSPLHNNEYLNSPTTPILKIRVIDTNQSSGGETNQLDYNKTVGQVTYLSSAFHHSNITPDQH